MVKLRDTNSDAGKSEDAERLTSLDAVRGVFLLMGQLAAYVIFAISRGHDFWGRDQNVGMALDGWMHFAPHPEHLVTFNVVPAAAVVLLGVLVGELVRTGLTPGVKVAVMTVG